MTQISATDAADADGFRVGRILGRSFGVLGRHFISFCILTAIPILTIAVVFGFTFLSAMGRGQPDQGQLVTMGLLAAGGVILWGVLQMVAQAVILYGTFQDMRGKPAPFGESVMKGLARFLPILGVAICTMLAVMAGMMLLVVPGVILLLAFYVSLPVCVVERLGPIQSMKRSAALTKGHRWKLLGLLLLVGVLTSIGGLVIAAVLAAFGNGAVPAIGRLIWQVAMSALSAVICAVAYHDLRVAKEGIDVERMAAVFD